MAAISKAQQAQTLYVQHGYPLADIAATLHLSIAKVTAWCQAENWDAARADYIQSPLSMALRSAKLLQRTLEEVEHGWITLTPQEIYQLHLALAKERPASDGIVLTMQAWRDFLPTQRLSAATRQELTRVVKNFFGWLKQELAQKSF